jgi:hypothetical protein
LGQIAKNSPRAIDFRFARDSRHSAAALMAVGLGRTWCNPFLKPTQLSAERLLPSVRGSITVYQGTFDGFGDLE